jgi:hypothetical protein
MIGLQPLNAFSLQNINMSLIFTSLMLVYCGLHAVLYGDMLTHTHTHIYIYIYIYMWLSNWKTFHHKQPLIINLWIIPQLKVKTIIQLIMAQLSLDSKTIVKACGHFCDLWPSTYSALTVISNAKFRQQTIRTNRIACRLTSYYKDLRRDCRSTWNSLWWVHQLSRRDCFTSCFTYRT